MKKQDKKKPDKVDLKIKEVKLKKIKQEIIDEDDNLLEDVIDNNFTPNSSKADKISPSLVMTNESQSLELQLQNAPLSTLDNKENNPNKSYVSANSQYSPSTVYEKGKGAYDSGGYPKLMKGETINPTLNPSQDNFSRPDMMRRGSAPVNEAWGGEDRDPSKKYESIDDQMKKEKRTRW
ncbi:MAG: hypothetical protein Q8N99_02995 [Nanoarchaeota archaeon]|nr:hypothetical protein [Nanoarchaeota archaeon]